MAEGLGESLAAEAAQTEKRRRIRYGAIGLLLPAGVSGCLFLFWIALRKRPESGEFTPEPRVPVELLETDPLEGFRFFPAVTVGCRLGAACGGGSPNELAPREAARGAPDLSTARFSPFPLMSYLEAVFLGILQGLDGVPACLLFRAPGARSEFIGN